MANFIEVFDGVVTVANGVTGLTGDFPVTGALLALPTPLLMANFNGGTIPSVFLSGLADETLELPRCCCGELIVVAGDGEAPPFSTADGLASANGLVALVALFTGTTELPPGGNTGTGLFVVLAEDGGPTGVIWTGAGAGTVTFC